MSNEDWARIAQAAITRSTPLLAKIIEIEDSPEANAYPPAVLVAGYRNLAREAWLPFWNALGEVNLDDLPDEPSVNDAASARNSIKTLIEFLRSKAAGSSIDPPADEPEWSQPLTQKQLAKCYRLSRNTVAKMLKSGAIANQEFGSRWQVDLRRAPEDVRGRLNGG